MGYSQVIEGVGHQRILREFTRKLQCLLRISDGLFGIDREVSDTGLMQKYDPFLARAVVQLKSDAVNLFGLRPCPGPSKENNGGYQ